MNVWKYKNESKKRYRLYPCLPMETHKSSPYVMVLIQCIKKVWRESKKIDTSLKILTLEIWQIFFPSASLNKKQKTYLS